MEGLGTEINVVIDNLSEKLGTTVNNVVPELVRYKQIESLSGVLVFLLILIIFGIIFKKLYNKITSDEETYYEEFYMVIASILCIIFILVFIIFIINLHSLIIWLFAPKGAAINYIISLIGK